MLIRPTSLIYYEIIGKFKFILIANTLKYDGHLIILLGCQASS